MLKVGIAQFGSIQVVQYVGWINLFVGLRFANPTYTLQFLVINKSH
jgi:hypothetical protein